MGIRKLIQVRGLVRLFEETLSDGSRVYDIGFGCSGIYIHAMDEREAREIFNFINAKSITSVTEIVVSLN